MKIILALFVFFLGSFLRAETPSLKHSGSVTLPGPVGRRFESLKVDYKNHYIYVAHFGADQVYVVDSNTGKYIKTISDTPGVGGIEYVSSLQKIYTSNFTDESIGVVDLKTMKVTKRISAEDKPNGSAYDFDHQKLYVADENSKNLIVIDVKTDRHVTKIHFESKLGMPQYDPVKKRVYVNLQDQNLIGVINPDKDSVESEFPVQKCKGNHGMAIDSALHLAFIGCEVSSTLIVYDLDLHKTISKFDIPLGVDGIAYDSKLKRVYAACDSGSIAILQVEDATHFHKLADFKIQDKVHSLAVNLENHKIFFPVEDDDGKPVSKLVILDAVLDKASSEKKLEDE